MSSVPFFYFHKVQLCNQQNEYLIRTIKKRLEFQYTYFFQLLSTHSFFLTYYKWSPGVQALATIPKGAHRGGGGQQRYGVGRGARATATPYPHARTLDPVPNKKEKLLRSIWTPLWIYPPLSLSQSITLIIHSRV